MLLDMIRQMLARRAAKQGDAPIDRGNQHKRFRFFAARKCMKPNGDAHNDMTASLTMIHTDTEGESLG